MSGADRILTIWDQFEMHLAKPPPSLQPLKVFTPKNPNIPKLEDYSRLPPKEWWEHWPSMTWEEGRRVKSPINPNKMVMWASKANHPDMAMVLEIANDVKFGCDLGTRGEYLCPSTSTNAPSAFQYGDRVTDSIVEGIKNKIMIGPMEEGDIPFKEEGIKVNGIMVRLKPDSSARVILNLSRGRPFCVNEGMSNEDRFDVKMSSTAMWLVSLHKAGRGSYFTKLDWSGKIHSSPPTPYFSYRHTSICT